jgi:lipoprotein-anchoring transpeptidase ErfK/SrfK
VPLLAASLVALLLSGASPARADGIQASTPAWQKVTAVLGRLRRQAVIRQDWKVLAARFPAPDDQDLIVVDIARQRLYFYADGQLEKTWSISTSRFGIGEEAGSMRTPTGVFRIVARVGAGEPDDEILKGRVPTNEIAQLVTAPDDPAASDTIVGRIFRLEGLEPGWNEGGDVDTFDRDVYIHGTANVGMIGRPASFGCIQMKPKAVVQLFAEVPCGTLVLIMPGPGNLDAIPGLALPTAPPGEAPVVAGNTRDTQDPGTATSFRTGGGDDPADSPDALPGT